MRNVSLATLVVVVLCGVLSAQMQLTTTYTSNNGQSGNMFDIVATNPVIIQTVDINVDAGTHTIAVYVVTGGGSYVGLAATPGAWTLVGTAPGVVSNGLNVATPVPLPLNVQIQPGQTQGFYVTVTTGTGMNYTNGSVVNTPYVSDPNITITEGIGVALNFGGTFSPRVWNGTVYYQFAADILDVAQPQGPGSLSVSLGMITASSTQGYTLLSTTTPLPVGTGPFAGIFPDGTTWIGLSTALGAGNPFHFLRTPGLYPDVPLNLPPGFLSAFAGQTWDLVVVLFDGTNGVVGNSNVQRITLQ
ncbi:MAG: hypothetical protein CMJ83_03640 [Planctomycetes bacterium]|nr:hypothetical protein [Planctomycetota bacterium]